MKPNPIDLRVRALSMALSALVTTGLLATIVGSMPPDFAGTPNDAGNGARDDGRIEVAIVPARIDVVGFRSEHTAQADVRAPRPRS